MTQEPTDKTLRDEFAIAALTGVLGKMSWLTDESMAKAAYSLADAMMEARKK